MGEILGLGLTHYPGFVSRDENMAGILRMILRDPDLPDQYRNPENWPEPMRREWGDDEGRSAAARHREASFAQIRKQRAILDEFRPDFIVIWGDDQYENFKEDIVPAFCVMAYDSIETKPWANRLPMLGPNPWGEPEDKTWVIKGHRSAGKYLAAGLLEEGFEVAYAYRPLHEGLGHAFVNTVLFLDVDRRGFEYPVVPFQVNCYGRRVISQRGFFRSIAENPQTEADLDPPSPAPWRCFDLGAATARILSRSPWRVALIASSSWSHAFLTPKNHYLYPDIEADKAYYEALVNGDYERWRNTTTAEIEERGHQELLNWFCLAGAMAELGRRPDEAAFVEAWIFNSSKVFAVFRP